MEGGGREMGEDKGRCDGGGGGREGGMIERKGIR